MMHLQVLLSALIGFSVLGSTQVSETPEAVMARLNSRVDSLLQKEPPALFAWHLRSLKALAMSEYSKLGVQSVPSQRRIAIDRTKEFVEYVGVIEKGLERDRSNPDDCLKNGRSALILARPSAIDGSLQYMMVDLPKDWDPKKEYPLVISLHGSGPENPLAYPSFAFGPMPAPKPDAAPGPSDSMIHLTPWGRGNRSWRGDAETDLWEAISLLKTFCKLDPNRWYISGHSSGADGTWAIAQHTPDLWAAVGIQSGSMLEGRPEWGLIPNMSYLPVYFLIGQNDSLPYRVPDMKEAYSIMSKLGDDTKLLILPGVGHYPLTDEGINAQMAWMVSHVRRRPDHFTFTVDQAAHPGVWGITVPFQMTQRRLLMQPWPSFECMIEGQEVHIKTKHIKQLRMDLGKSGLQMSGDVKVWVNSKSVHEGPIPSEIIKVDKV